MQRVSRSLALLRSTRYATSSPEGVKTIPEAPLVRALREGMKDAMRARDTPRANTFKSVLGDINTSSHSKARIEPLKTLKKAIAVRIDAQAKVSQSSDLAGQYEREIATLSEYLDEEDQSAIVEAKLRAQQSTLEISELLKELRNEFGSRLDSDIIVSIGKAASARKIP